MSIYLDEKNPGKHKPFDDASPDIVEYVRYLEVIAGKSPNTAFSYYCDLRNFSKFMKRRRGLVPDDVEMKDIDPKGLDTAFWAVVSKEDIYEYLYFLSSECGNKKSSTARRLASLHGFYDYLTNQVNRIRQDPTAAIRPPKQDKVLPKYLTAEQSMDLLESTQYQSDFPERDYCMVVLFLNCGMRLSELVGMDLGDIDLEQRQIRLFGKGHKERMVYLNDACIEALRLYLAKRNTMEGMNPKERAVFVTRRRKDRISNRRVEQLIKASQNAGSEYAAPKPQCKKLDAGAGKSFAHHRPTLTKKHTKCRHTVKSAFHKPGRPKWMPEMPKGIKSGKDGFFAPLIFV